MEPLTIETIRRNYWDAEKNKGSPITIIAFQGQSLEELKTDNFQKYEWTPDGSLVVGLDGKTTIPDWLSWHDAEDGPYHTVFDRNTLYFIGGVKKTEDGITKYTHLQVCYHPRNVVAEDCLDWVFCWADIMEKRKGKK